MIPGIKKNATRPTPKQMHLSARARDRMHALMIFGAVIVFGVSMVLSVIAARSFQKNLRELAAKDFEQETQVFQSLVQDQLDGHINALFGAQGIFIASESVERVEWSTFVNRLNFRRRFPAITAVAFVEYVQPGGKETFEESIRTDTSVSPLGFPDFAVHPEGERGEYFVVKYIEPFEVNEDLFGLDAGFYEGAMLRRVRDSGELMSIGRTELVRHERDFVIAMPIYRNGASQRTVKDRREALVGFVAATLNPVLLLDHTISLASRSGGNPGMAITLVDARGDNIFHRHAVNLEHDEDVFAENLEEEFPVTAPGIAWTLRFNGPNDFGLQPDQIKIPQYVLLGGWGFSLMVFLILYLLANARLRALRLAGRMTGELGKFQLAVKNASNHIIITDQDGKILYANPAVQKITGYSYEEIIGNNSSLWGKQMDESYYKNLWHTVKEMREPYVGELVNKRKDGTLYDALVYISPILDRQGNLFGFVGIEEDITERKQLEKTRSEFVSLASHQLRTPLTAMRLTLETLLNGAVGEVDDAQKGMLLRAQEYALHMSETILTMLTISHIESGGLSVVNATVDLKSFFEKMCHEYEIEYTRKKQQVSCSCEEGLTMETDPKLLREIIANLASNAIKYTPEGGSITVSAKREDDHLRIDVSDTGYGIPKDQHNRIFQKFFRAPNVVKKETSGTGLGLYLVHSLITLLGGSISFVSEKDKGTTFSLFLPFTPPTHEQDTHR